MREICQIDHDPFDTLHSIGLNWECGDENPPNCAFLCALSRKLRSKLRFLALKI